MKAKKVIHQSCPACGAGVDWDAEEQACSRCLFGMGSKASHLASSKLVLVIATLTIFVVACWGGA